MNELLETGTNRSEPPQRTREAVSQHALWIYFAASTLGMLVAAEVFLQVRGGVGPYCAKLHHANNKRCIFRHGSRTAPTREFCFKEIAK